MGYKYLKFTSAGAQKNIMKMLLKYLKLVMDFLLFYDGVGGDYGGDLAAKIALKSALYFLQLQKFRII